MTRKKAPEKPAKATTAPKATTKPKKPAKGVYVAPSPDDWGNKPALLKLRREFGENASVAIHKLQFELRQAKAKLKGCLEILRFAHCQLSGVVASKVQDAIEAIEKGK